MRTTSSSALDVVRTTTGIFLSSGIRLDLGERLAAVHLRHVEVEQDDPRPRRVVAVRVLPSLAQVIDQLLPVDDEAQVVGEPRAGERLLGEEAILLVVVGDQDRDRLAAQTPARLPSTVVGSAPSASALHGRATPAA